MVSGDHGLGASFGVLAGPTEFAGDRERGELLWSGLQFAAESAAYVGRDHPDLGLWQTRRCGDAEAQDVRDLSGRPHDHLLAGGVDNRRARLHEGWDEPLLTVLPLDDDAVFAGLGNGLVDIAASTGRRRIQRPHVTLVGPDDLTGVRDPLERDREVSRGLLVRRQRPRGDIHALDVGDVLAGKYRDDTRGGGRLRGVDRGDRGVREGAAHHSQMQHSGELDVVSPPGATGDESAVFLAATGLANLGLGTVVNSGHLTHLPSPRRTRP